MEAIELLVGATEIRSHLFGGAIVGREVGNSIRSHRLLVVLATK